MSDGQDLAQNKTEAAQRHRKQIVNDEHGYVLRGFNAVTLFYAPVESNCTKLCGGQGPEILKAMSSSICAAEELTAASN